MIHATSRRERRLHEWLRRARGGDLEALVRLAEEAGTELWRVATLLTDEAHASDLVAATVQVALAARTRMPDAGQVRLSLLRHLYQVAEARPVPGSGLLALLPPRHRAFHALTQVGGLSYEQVASVCAVDPATVRAGCAAARKVLMNRGPDEPRREGSHPRAGDAEAFELQWPSAISDAMERGGPHGR